MIGYRASVWLLLMIPTTGLCTVTIPREFLREKQLTLLVYDAMGKLVENVLMR